MSVCEDTRKACLKCTIAVDIVPGGKFLVFSRRAHTYFCLASCISFHLLVVMHAFKMRFRGAAEIHVSKAVGFDGAYAGRCRQASLDVGVNRIVHWCEYNVR